MESVPKSDSNECYCKGCLTRDRELRIITSIEINKWYSKMVQEKLQDPGPLILCWECIANVHRFRKFRRQALVAHDILLRHMLSPVDIPSLSTLTIVRNTVQITISDTSEENTEINFTTTLKEEKSQSKVYPTTTTSEETGPHVLYRQLNDYNMYTEFVKSVEKSEEVILPTDAEQRNVQYFKIEGDGGVDDGGGYFVDDGYHHEDEIDDKSFAVDLEPGYMEKTKAKSKRNKKKIADDQFNESDEEPLKKKKKTTGKERKHKKKKDGSKTDKKLVVKREKPAGVVSNPRVQKKLKQLNVGEGQLEMVVLSWEEVEEERQRALSSVVFTRHQYRCQDCILGFNHRFKLDNHMKKHDTSAGDMVCNVCRVRCRDAHALCAHKRRHRVRWRCCTCGSTWSRAAVAADHAARAHHAPPPTHTCTVCGHAEPTLGKLRNHIKNHAERQKCELCGKTFKDRTSLRTHLFIHKGEKEYSCPRCDKKFLFKKAMEVHLETHQSSAHLYCYQCDMNFKNRMSYTQHMKYSLKHIDPAKLKFSCGACDKRFSKAGRLRDHQLALHLKLTPITCTHPGCDFACSSRPVLRTHIRMVHRNKRAQRNYVCHTCGKAYTSKKTLEGHLRSHSGERPFACPLCPSTFGYEAALYNHNKLVHLKGKTCRAPIQPQTLQASEPALMP